MKKVVWPTKKEFGPTAVVIATCAVYWDSG
ncbi:MAG: preprotein translocase subunit SecE [Emergencia sp.]